jgi:hypothetical protein
VPMEIEAFLEDLGTAIATLRSCPRPDPHRPRASA